MASDRKTREEAAKIAKAYPAMLKSSEQADNRQKAAAVRRALEGLNDDSERELVRRNLIEKVSLQRIPMPLSLSTMKRIRARFLRLLAQELGMYERRNA